MDATVASRPTGDGGSSRCPLGTPGALHGARSVPRQILVGAWGAGPPQAKGVRFGGGVRSNPAPSSVPSTHSKGKTNL